MAGDLDKRMPTLVPMGKGAFGSRVPSCLICQTHLRKACLPSQDLRLYLRGKWVVCLHAS